jgi:superfamily II DNA or RNA helicase
MIYSIIEREPNVGYVDNWLWLPKKQINYNIVKRGLTVAVTSDLGMGFTNLWLESPHHLGIPRARLDPSALDYEVVDLRPKSFPKVDYSHNNIVMDKLMPNRTEQQDAFDDLTSSNGGILNLACGKGKTIIYLHAIAKWRQPTLVICNTAQLMKQWVSEATNPELFNMDKANIGWIQGKPKTWNWEKPLVVASLKTLAMYHDRVPPEMLLWFGKIIWDECHHLSAREFCKTAPIFLGERFGASATTKRADGLEFIYYWHIGREVHTNLEQDVIPTVLFRKSGTVIDLHHKNIVDRVGKIHHRKLTAYVGQREREIKLIKEIVDDGLKKGREMVAISMSKEHAQRLHELTPGSGVLHGSIPEKERPGMLNDHNIVFGTVDMLSEALNKKTLDSLIIMVEFRSRKNAQQATGRIQRLLLNREKKAKVIVIFHVNIPPLRRLGLGLMTYFKQCGFQVKVK